MSNFRAEFGPPGGGLCGLMTTCILKCQEASKTSRKSWYVYWSLTMPDSQLSSITLVHSQIVMDPQFTDLADHKVILSHGFHPNATDIHIYSFYVWQV